MQVNFSILKLMLELYSGLKLKPNLSLWSLSPVGLWQMKVLLQEGETKFELLLKNLMVLS